MDDRRLRAMIQHLYYELEQVRYAIWSLEAVASGKPRRGRPPKGKPKVPREPEKRGPRA